MALRADQCDTARISTRPYYSLTWHENDLLNLDYYSLIAARLSEAVLGDLRTSIAHCWSVPSPLHHYLCWEHPWPRARRCSTSKLGSKIVTCLVEPKLGNWLYSTALPYTAALRVAGCHFWTFGIGQTCLTLDLLCHMCVSSAKFNQVYERSCRSYVTMWT